MAFFGFAGEVWIEIRIAFPEWVVIAVGDTGLAVVIRLIDCVSPPWQTVAVGEIDRFAEWIVRGPVSALVDRIAPRSPRIPMPDFTGKLGAQTIRQRPEPGWEHLGDVLLGEHSSAFAFFVPINTCAQSLCWHALVYGMTCGHNSWDYERLLAATYFCLWR